MVGLDLGPSRLRPAGRRQPVAEDGGLGQGAPPQWLSTHPAGKNRIEEIQRHLPEVMPLYEAARKRG